MKIMIIPSYDKINKKSLLLFMNNEIKAIKIANQELRTKSLIISEHFPNSKFNDFQFIISLDFILILKYDKINQKKWIGKVFLLNQTDDKTLFDYFTKIEIEEDEHAKFSLYERTPEKYLFSINIIDNKPIIKYHDIICYMSGTRTDSISNESRQNKNKKIPLGNCFLNYFFHCFEKYPLLGAIQYKKSKNSFNFNNLSTNLSFFIEKNNTHYLTILQDYIIELKKYCQNQKEIDFDDIKFSCTNYNNNIETFNSSLADILINILEITPIHIAKFYENQFKIMSDYDYIEAKFNKGDKNIFNVDEYSKMIKFCIKDSIFNFYNFPIIAICCFGNQSIGKSTFLNEITGSLFNVSGMRCTEGIWMSLKLFKSNKNITQEKCKEKCILCNNNDCSFFYKHDFKCLCEKCRCDQNCLLKACNNKCFLQKKILIRCSYPNCNCKCLYDCICKKNKNIHNHFCQKCKMNNSDSCQCKCECCHLCDIPVLNHDFICVSLDFEGLGSIERKKEQEIQMSLVGSAIGNIIIFRIGNFFGDYTKNILDKISLGSRKIRFTNNEEKFFGGSIAFSPRDVITSEGNNVEKEIVEGIELYIDEWNRNKVETIN